MAYGVVADDCCRCRMETAHAKAEHTKTVAIKAYDDAALARQKAAEFEHVELHVGTFEHITRLYV